MSSFVDGRMGIGSSRGTSATLEALAAEAWVLEPPPPHERKSVLRDEAAFLLDRLLTSVARGHGALEIAIGRGLSALAEGDNSLRLGFSSIGDYARERLGIAAGTAQKLARLSRALRERPLLWEAVRRGEVSARKAEDDRAGRPWRGRGALGRAGEDRDGAGARGGGPGGARRRGAG